MIMLFISLCFCTACSDDQTVRQFPMQEIKGRDYEGKRFDVYRVRVPPSWVRRDALPDQSLSDTTQPLCEFLISGTSDSIRITLHNFPTDRLTESIPPTAQVFRWQRQFEELIPEESTITPQAFSGYNGLKFKGVGRLNKKDSMMLGWALQISQEHYQALTRSNTPLFREMRGDITIKAVGPKELMEQKEEEIHTFARSFELIEEIPSRS
jgi:hypothetical protein